MLQSLPILPRDPSAPTPIYTAFRNTETGQANRLHIDAALRDVDEYSEAVNVVTSMLGVDFASAVS
jgi:hypothetical protein